MKYKYMYDGGAVELPLDPATIAVRFSDDVPLSARARAAGAVPGLHGFASRFEIPGEHLTFLPLRPPCAGGIGPAATMDALDNRPEVAKAHPVFRVGANRAAPTGRAIAALKNPDSIRAIVRKFEISPLRERNVLFLLRAAPHTDIFELCTQMEEEDEVLFVEPDFVVVGRHLAVASPGPSPLATAAPAAEQYGMRVTRAFDAQAVQPGRPDIRVAILGEGVDTAHPDLTGALAACFNAISGDDYQDPTPGEVHGTACAGLAVAIGGGGAGIRGAGAGCSLVAVRIASFLAARGVWVATTETIARGIDWAFRHGRADILCLCVSGLPPSNAIDRAIAAARRDGRDGRGSIVVVPAGDLSGPVLYPATVQGVLAVTASNEFDEVKTIASGDGETWWGSCSGPEVSIAAPGVHHLAARAGGAHGLEVGGYVQNFAGTASAAAIVAGACGLVLSANPASREAEARAATMGTADRIGSAPYRDGHNRTVGHGRLNVLEAVVATRNRR